METDTFDVKVGMDVYGVSGQMIGRVREVSGFGSTHVDGLSEGGHAELVTEARTSTGYLSIDRTGVLGSDAKDSYVPFHAIAGIDPARGVILSMAMTGEPDSPAEMNDQKPAPERWVSFDEAASITGRSDEGLRERVQSGKIRSKRRSLISRSRLYSREDAERESYQHGEAQPHSSTAWVHRAPTEEASNRTEKG